MAVRKKTVSDFAETVVGEVVGYLKVGFGPKRICEEIQKKYGRKKIWQKDILPLIRQALNKDWLRFIAPANNPLSEKLNKVFKGKLNQGCGSFGFRAMS